MDNTNLSLKNFCIVRIAAHLWDLKQDEVEKMLWYFRHDRVKPKEEMWNKLTRETIKPLESVTLPCELYNEIVYSVYLMKQRILDWLEHAKSSFAFHDMTQEKFLDLYFKKISWTQFGTIDGKTIASSYHSLIHKPDSDWWKLFIFASQFCSELTISELLMNMDIWTERTYIKKINFYESYECHLALFWYKWYYKQNNNDFIRNIKRNNGDPLHFYSERLTVYENLFKLVLHFNLKQGVLYFWPRVDAVKRERIIIDYFNNPLTDKLFKNCQLGNNYKGMQKCEIHFYIWNNASENFKELIAATKNFSENVIKSSDWPIWNWPINLLLIPINKMRKYFTSELHKDFCSAITHQNKKIYSDDLKLPVKDNRFQSVFNQLWKIIPLDCKKDVAEKVIDDLFASMDILNLKAILNDKNLNHLREKFIEKGYNKFMVLIEENNQIMIQEFFCELLIPEALTKDVEEILRNLYQNIIEGKFDVAKWAQKSSNDFKKHINDKFICYYLIKKDRFDLADKFLMWKLGNAKSVKSYKATFYADKFSVGLIYKLWGMNRGNSQKAETQCNKFLDWFLGDGQKERFFLQEKIAKEIINCPAILNYHFIENDNVEMMDDFLIRWLVLTKKEIRAIKKKIFDKSSLYKLMEDHMVNNKINIARKTLECAFESEEARHNFLVEFFDKKAAIRGVKDFISDVGTFDVFEPKPTAEEIRTQMREFINFWCKPLKKFDKLKKELERWPELCRKEIDPTTDSAELDQIYLEGVGEEPDRHDYHYSYDAYLNAYYDYLDEAGIYFSFCEEQNLKIFMKLLKCFEANNGEFCC